MRTDIPISDPNPPRRIEHKLEKKRNMRSARKSRAPKNRLLLRLFKVCLLTMVCLTTLISVHLYSSNLEKYKTLQITIDNILAGKYHLLQTTDFSITTGMDLEAMHFLERLEELQYQRENTQKDLPSRFYIEGNVIFLNTPATASNYLAKKYRMVLKGPVLADIFDITGGKRLQSLTFPSITLTHFLDSIWEIRKPVRYEEIPQNLIHAVLATEDQNFLHHPGIDMPGVIRAVFANLRAGKVVQGGSTITQQTVKVLTGESDRTFTRKLNEALLAIALDYHYSKEELLTVYLNNVYLGHATPFEIRGIAAAADYILDKKLSEINLEECAILAGLIRSPNSASPLRNPETAARRTQTVLTQMAKQGDHLAGEISVGKKLQRIRHSSLLDKQSWYFDQLSRELQQKRITITSSDEQLIIETPLDPWMQIAATKALSRQLHLLENKSTEEKKNLEGATVILDSYTGGVKALVGGRSYLQSPYNRAASAKRQIGSLIKPFIYLTALGGTNVAAKITQADAIPDRPITIRRDGTIWKPTNYDQKYKGNVLVRSALTGSRNIPAVQLGQRIGLEAFLPIVKMVNIADQPQPFPSLFLGAVESTPLRMAGAYAAIANGGNSSQPFLLSRVIRGDVTIYQPSAPKAVFSPAPCYVLTDILTAVMTEGTGRRSKQLGFRQIAAGKTGTTNNTNDSWFAGFTPSLVTVTWVGRDDNKSSGLTGATGALPVWAATMDALLGKSESIHFPVPPGVYFTNIDPATGQAAGFFNQDAVRMAFVAGTEPSEKTDWLQEGIVGSKTTQVLTIQPQNKKRILRRTSPEQQSETWLTTRIKWFRKLF